MTVTLFRSLFENSPKYYDAKVLLEVFRQPRPETQSQVEQLRKTANEEEQERLKKTLPVVLWCGEFSERKASAMKSYSRLIVLDFDDVDVTIKKRELSLNPHIYACWISPRGNGVKALVKVASDNHAGHFKALEKEFKGLDPSGKDVSRACFVSFDKELYLNEHAEIYGKIVESAFTDEQKLEKLKKWLENKGEAFVSGNRNNFLAKLAGAANRFGLTRKFIEETFVREYCGSDFAEREALTVINSMYTNYAEEHGTASFEDSFSQEEVKNILSSELPDAAIITAIEIKEDMMKVFDEGVKPGETTYLPGFDNHFRWMRGELTTLTGLPNFGKSFLAQQLLLFRAVFNNEKFQLLSPEQYPPTFFYQELIRALIGKPIEKDDPNRMSRAEYARGLEFISNHFFYTYPKQGAASPDWTMARFAEGIIKHGISGVVVDPVNSQDHDKRKAGGRDDVYIGEMLVKEKNFALQQNIYFLNVAHPKSIGKNEDGTYKEPGADDINGGPIWWAKSDNILVFHRPSLPLNFLDTTATLRSTKIKKMQLNGRPGATVLQYDMKTGRYYEDGYNPLNDFVL